MHWEVEAVSCSLCRTDNSIELFNNDSHGFGLRTVICKNCGLVYLNPRPTAAEYARLYSGIYETLFPTAFLEVGPGDGAFLKLLKANSGLKSVSGIEPSPKAVEVCRKRGLDVEEGYLTSTSPAGQFDCVAAFHVLEHALDPMSLLRVFHSRLNDNGTLLVEVPNILGNWRGLGMIHIAHPSQFSPDSLRFALSLAGFRVLAIDALEEPVFESSIRAIARKVTTSEAPVRPAVPVLEIQRLFNERLATWKLDLFKYRAKRTVFRLTGVTAAKRFLSLRRLSAV
jgi:SAM-dependent methyltransferase